MERLAQHEDPDIINFECRVEFPNDTFNLAKATLVAKLDEVGEVAEFLGSWLWCCELCFQSFLKRERESGTAAGADELARGEANEVVLGKIGNGNANGFVAREGVANCISNG